MEPAKRERRKRGGPAWSQVIGTVVAYQAATGALKPPDVVSRETARVLVDQTVDALREKLLSGPDDDLIAFAQRAQAQAARFSSVDDLAADLDAA